MTNHLVTYSYIENDQTSMDIDPLLDKEEKEAAAIAELKDQYYGVAGLEIIKIEEVL
jgi:hypothetical protein